MEKQYKNIEDVLPVGTHQVKVFPKREWSKERKDWIDGSIKHGIGKKGGEWWLYQTPIGEDDKKEWISIFANSKNKAFFDSGMVEVVIKQKYDPDTGKPILRAYYNESKRDDEPQPTQGKDPDEDVSVEKVPF